MIRMKDKIDNAFTCHAGPREGVYNRHREENRRFDVAIHGLILWIAASGINAFLAMTFITFIPLSSLAQKNLEIPRFATIKASEANTRKGPGAQYPAVFMYHHKGLPVEIISEYEQWRQIRDINGDEGWIHSSILSGKRSIIILGKDDQLLYKSNSLKSKVIAKLSPNLVCSLSKCQKSWCKVKCQDKTGWVGRSSIWGVYEHEEL